CILLPPPLLPILPPPQIHASSRGRPSSPSCLRPRRPFLQILTRPSPLPPGSAPRPHPHSPTGAAGPHPCQAGAGAAEPRGSGHGGAPQVPRRVRGQGEQVYASAPGRGGRRRYQSARAPSGSFLATGHIRAFRSNPSSQRMRRKNSVQRRLQEIGMLWRSTTIYVLYEQEQMDNEGQKWKD
ncbi:unnamed protein product, partial [Urochloa humidicola]